MKVGSSKLKNNHTDFVYNVIIVRFGQTKVRKETFHAAKKPIKTWDVNVDNTVISKLIEKNQILST